MSREWRHMYVIYRIDYFQPEGREGADLSRAVTIKQVVDTEDEAEAEVRRLTALKDAGDSRYYCQSAKYYLGPSASPS